MKAVMFYGWKYSHYFQIVEEGDKNLQARCTLCSPCKKPLLSALNTTSNFKKHLETAQVDKIGCERTQEINYSEVA